MGAQASADFAGSALLFVRKVEGWTLNFTRIPNSALKAPESLAQGKSASPWVTATHDSGALNGARLTPMPVGLSCAAFRAPESFFYSVPQGDVRGLTLPWAGDLGPFGAHSRLFETVKRIKFRLCHRTP